MTARPKEMASPSEPIEALFAQFIRLRRAGWGRSSAWQLLETETQALLFAERQRLTDLLGEWEAAEGGRYPSTRGEDPFAIRRSAEARPSEMPREAGTGRVRHIALDSQIPLENEAPTQPVEVAEGDGSFFSAEMSLYLDTNGPGDGLLVRVGVGILVLGRQAPGSPDVPGVDLTPLDAENYGVSRRHAAIRRYANTLIIIDLGSRNFTYINGHRLYPHEIRVLREGDELQLGRMRLTVCFRWDQ